MGAGPHWASAPETPAPRPKPAVRVREARRARAGGSASCWESSLIQLVPTTMATATLTPLTSRPRHIAIGLEPPRPRMMLPTMPRTSATVTSFLRPCSSENGPGHQESGDEPEDVEGEEQVDLDGAVAVDLPVHQQQRGEVIAAPGRHGDRGCGPPPGSGRDEWRIRRLRRPGGHCAPVPNPLTLSNLDGPEHAPIRSEPLVGHESMSRVLSYFRGSGAARGAAGNRGPTPLRGQLTTPSPTASRRDLGIGSSLTNAGGRG